MMATWDVGCSGCSPTHARRDHRLYGTTGHVWQSRFNAFPVQVDDHLVSVLCDVERNALRAELESRAEDWKWSGLPGWGRGDPLLWRGEEPVRDERWLERVNEPLSAGDLQRFGTRCRGADRMAKTPGLGRRRSGWAWIRACVPRDDRVRRTSKSPMSPVSPVATLQLAKVEHLLKEAAACGYGVLFE
jgi:hypothetical protein